MALSLASILPNTLQTLDGSGFFFGAGTSFEAGYPLMSTLTTDVVNGLKTSERDLLDEVLTSAAEIYDDALGLPNIERLADLVIAHRLNSGLARFASLEDRFRELVLDRILSVTNPTLDHHCTFLESLKRRAFGLACTVWIFTTNYDLLIETAAARCGIPVENCFAGTTERFFCPLHFKSTTGTITGGRFAENKQLTIKLVKLHGSISWAKEGTQFVERHPAALTGCERILILPRRRKVIDTLTPPFDSLFTIASRALGHDCKYLVSCGFGYGDEHINQQIILPALQSNRCRLFALDSSEPIGVQDFKPLPSFNAAYADSAYTNCLADTSTTDCWQFSKFVTLF